MPPTRFRAVGGARTSSSSSSFRGGSAPPAPDGEAMAEDTAGFFAGLGGPGAPARPAGPARPEGPAAQLPGESIPAGSSEGSGRQTQSQVMWIELGLCKALVRAVSHAGFLAPTPVQAEAVPVVLSGSDVCARAVTGSGKTAAFLLPVLHLLLTRAPVKQSMTSSRRRFLRAVVLVPTRELGVQCEHMLRQLLAFTTGLTVALAIGGVAQSAQEAALEAVPDILIATPGRLVDLLYNYKGAHGMIDVSGVEIVVLDECDKMLTVTLRDQVVDVLKRIPEETRQVLMFSATMTTEVDEFAKEHLFEPKNVDIGHVALQSKLRQQFVRIHLGPIPTSTSTSTSTEAHGTINKGKTEDEDEDEDEADGEEGDIQKTKKKRIRSKRLREASRAEEKERNGDTDAAPDEHVTKVKSRYLVALCEHYFREKTMIFTRYRTTAHRLHLLFTALGLSSAELQGNQLQEERFASLQRFASGEARYLFSTDVASRGLDIKGVAAVINVDLPPTLTAYIHRVGRTARIGDAGTAVSLVNESTDAAVMRKILAVSGVVSRHQAASVKRRDVPPALLSAAAARINAAFPIVRDQLQAEALEAQIQRMERRIGKAGNAAEKVLDGSAAPRAKRQWCLSAAERSRRDAEARRLYEREAEVLVNRFQNELAGWSREEKAFLGRQRQERRQEREKKARAKEKTKNLAKEERRKAQQKVQAGVVKKLKKKKIREARKAKRAESREKNGKPAYKHRDGKKGLKKSRHNKRMSRH